MTQVTSDVRRGSGGSESNRRCSNDGLGRVGPNTDIALFWQQTSPPVALLAQLLTGDD